MGPRSRELLTRLSGDDFSDSAFPFGTPCSRCRLRGAGHGAAHDLRRRTRLRALASRPESAAVVYQGLFDAGADLGVTPAGYYAIDAMRLERAIAPSVVN